MKRSGPDVIQKAMKKGFCTTGRAAREMKTRGGITWQSIDELIWVFLFFYFLLWRIGHEREFLSKPWKLANIFFQPSGSAAGAPRRGLQRLIFPETELAPPCRTEALREGALPNIQCFKIFIDQVW